MKKLPIGIQTFRDVIEEDYLYVDKTRDIHKLMTDGGKYFFLSRPRRFGKSLLISTLKEIFSGNKELFKNLWIYDKIKWQKYPVIHIDFLNIGQQPPDKLEESLTRMVGKIAANYNIQIAKQDHYKNAFGNLIEELGKKSKVIILIDEYDKPIIDYVDDKEKAAKNRDILRNFYTTIKGMDEYIKFAMLTGVSKFSRVSVFSDLNNLRDITMTGDYASMLGYTEEELRYYFGERIEILEKQFNKSKEDLLADIKRWYNGYSWDGVHYVYNPLSILNFFQEGKFSNYWFTTGTPTFLVKMIRDKKLPPQSLGSWEADEHVFDSYDIEKIDIASLLFQTGYITIKNIKTINHFRKYHLSYPNQEVKDAFLKYLLADFIDSSPGSLGSLIFDLTDQLINKQLEQFFQTLKSLFAGIPYNIFIPDKEAYYHSVIFLVLTLLGVHIKAEVQTNTGRIDATIETDNTIYILEFKMGSAQEALDQIQNQNYAVPYLSQPKALYIIGIGFDKEQRNITSHLHQQIQ